MSNSQYQSYRALVADALSPKPASAGGNVVFRELRFKPSAAALQKANDTRRRIETEESESSDFDT